MPAGQVEQATPPPTPWKVPEAQAVQTPAPAPEYFPAPQAMQAKALVAAEPTDAPADPATHKRQDDFPVEGFEDGRGVEAWRGGV